MARRFAEHTPATTSLSLKKKKRRGIPRFRIRIFVGETRRFLSARAFVGGRKRRGQNGKFASGRLANAIKQNGVQ